MIALWIACTLGISTLFDVVTIPLDNPDAQVLFAQASADPVAALLVLEGNRLSVHSATSKGQPAVDLPEGTSVFDVADLDDDSVPELVLIKGNLVARLPFGQREPSPLFEAETLLSASSRHPKPYTIVVSHEGEKALALPTEEALEIRGIDGALLATYPVAEPENARGFLSASLAAWTVWPPQVAPMGGLEMRLSRIGTFPYELPPALACSSPHSDRPGRRIPASQLMDIADLDPSNWPWFPLRAGDDAARVLFAPAKPSLRDTLVIVRGKPKRLAPWAAQANQPEPARRYPGLLVNSVEDTAGWARPGPLPDFNGDGFTDLLLWDAPEPGRSVESLTRAASLRTWPVRVAARLYDAGNQRYESKPSGLIESELPIAWFLLLHRGTPMRSCVLRDFNGDGQTDCGWRCDERRFAVWLYGDRGFTCSPAFSIQLPEPDTHVELVANLDGVRWASIVLRGSRAVYWLYARPDEERNQPSFLYRPQ